jgi:hypothetical protein
MLTGRLVILFTFVCNVLFLPIKIYSSELNEIPPLNDKYGYIIKDISDSCVTYVNKKGKEYVVHLNGVIFEGGETSLKKMIYNSLQKDYECNIREVIVIFFNKNLKIKEVRMCNIGASDNHIICEHNKDYIRAIKKTKALWKKNVKEKYYIYIFSMHIH